MQGGTGGRAISAEEMIQRQIIARGVTDRRVIDALRVIPRDRFTPPGEEAFADQAAPIGHGQTISQPYIVALMTSALDLSPSDRVLEIGTGSGYQTAVLSKVVAEVWSIERVKPLLDGAFERLQALSVRNFHLRHGDGTLGWPEAAPFDRILAAAGAPELPERLLTSQLREGGVAVLPVGPHDNQTLLRVTKQGGQLVRQTLCPVRFVKLIGAEGWQSA